MLKLESYLKPQSRDFFHNVDVHGIHKESDKAILELLRRGTGNVHLAGGTLLLVVIVLADFVRPWMLENVLLVHGQENERLQTDHYIVQLGRCDLTCYLKQRNSKVILPPKK